MGSGGINGKKLMLANSPWDNIEQILIVISLRRLLARWWMAAHLPLCRVPERVFNMTIKCLSFGFLLRLPLSILWASFPPGLSPLLPLHGIPSVRCSVRADETETFPFKTEVYFSPSVSGRCPYILWHELCQFYVAVRFSPPSSSHRLSCSNWHKPFRPFALRFFPLLSRFPRYESKMAGRTWKFA